MSEYLIQGETLTAIADAIRTKTGGSDALSPSDMPDAIDGIEAGVELPTLTSEGSASDLLSGKQLIDGDGAIVTGTFTIDDELEAQDSLISQIQTALEGKAAGSGGGSKKTVRITNLSSDAVVYCFNESGEYVPIECEETADALGGIVVSSFSVVCTGEYTSVEVENSYVICFLTDGGTVAKITNAPVM